MCVCVSAQRAVAICPRSGSGGLSEVTWGHRREVVWPVQPLRPLRLALCVWFMGSSVLCQNAKCAVRETAPVVRNVWLCESGMCSAGLWDYAVPCKDVAALWAVLCGAGLKWF